MTSIFQWSTLILSLNVMWEIAAAAPVVATAISGPNAPSTTTDEITFAGDVSNSDLLHGITGTGGTWLGNGSSPNGLNDGAAGGDFDADGLAALGGKAWASNADNVSFREFELGVGSGAGFDISSIQSIASWQGAGFMNQKYAISIRLVGAVSFTPLTTVDYQPFPATPLNNGGSTKVTVTDDAGLLASGIEAIRFDILNTTSNTGGGTVFSEIDVFGTATVSGPDETPPTLNTLNSVIPADDSTDVPVSSKLEATFSEGIALSGAGSITLKNLSGGSDIPVSLLGDVAISDRVMTINPASNLTVGQEYAVVISNDAIKDISGNPYAGLMDTDTPNWSFTASSVGLPIKVFLLGGQSNSVGQAPSSGLPTGPVDLQQPQDDILFCHDGSPLTTLRPGSGGNPPPSGLHFGPEVTFGRAVADASPSVAYAIIKHGENGTALYNDWAPGTGASYTAFQNTVDAGLAALPAAGYTPEIVGMLWHQGESDAIEGQQGNYEGNLTAFIADVRSRYGADLPFLIGEIRRSNGAAFVTVADAQIAVAAADVNAGFVPASDLTFSDTYHFDAPGMITLGERFATAYANLTADLTAPTISSLSPSNGLAEVPLASDLVITFNEDIAIGSGNITIKNLDAPSQNAIPVGDARISISGAILTINPSSNLAPDTRYAVQIAGTAIRDVSGNLFVGISDDLTWNFTTAATPLRIMCLGDSITVGYTDNPSWANHPFMFGYRSGLYTRLTNAGRNFQLVGGSTEPWTGISGDPTNGGTYTPALDLRDFGQDGHRGYGGAGIWSNVNAWIAADSPDVILLLIGINGIGAGSPAALNTLVNSIVTTAPDVHLIVAQITPRASFNQNLYDYNVYIRDTLVPTYAGNGHKVTTVDLYSLFLTDPNDYTSAIEPGVLSNNINHPDNPHYDLMAQRWFEGIEALGVFPTEDFSNWISGFNVGGLSGFDEDADGDGIDNGLENFFGTAPDVANAGLSAVALTTDGSNVFTFTHPQNATPASDISAPIYQWSSDLAAFHADGATVGDMTVDFVALNDAETGVTTVAATITGPVPAKLFVNVSVTENP